MYIRTYVYTYTCICILHICIHICVRCIFRCICIYTFIYVYAKTLKAGDMSIQISAAGINLYTHICTYIYIY